MRMNGWIGTAVYGGNIFDGGADIADPNGNPTGKPKDGSHFGSPLNLVFTNNAVYRMGVEAVFQTDDTHLGTTAEPFIIPPPDGATVASVTVRPMPTTYKPGQSINVRTWFFSGAQATNVFLRVTAYDPLTRLLRFVNEGLTLGVEGLTVPTAQPIYLQDYDPTFAVISGNQVIGGNFAGDIGICSNSKARIEDNFVSGYRYGIRLYENVRNVLSPPTPGTLIQSNVVVTWNSLVRGYCNGIDSAGPSEIIRYNLVATPYSYWVRGVVVRGTNAWIEGNIVVPGTIRSQEYASPFRSVGIAFGNLSRGNTAKANSTFGMDVGVGPENPFQAPPHRVISHFSYNDGLPVDPRGVE